MNLLQRLEAEQAAGWPSRSPEELGRQGRHLRRLLELLAAVMADDEKRHRQVHSDASRRSACRQWADMGTPKRSTG